jgi:phosphoglycolate phosphatase
VKVDAAVFDVDGVLIDSLGPVTASINAALRDHGLAERPQADLRRFVGPPTFSAFAELLGLPPEAPEVLAAVATYRGHYAARYLAQTTVFEGVAAMLEELSRHLPLAVATSKSADFARPLLEALDLARFFAAIAAAAPAAADDDKTAIVGRALASLRERGAREVAMVGDRHFDIEAAHAHGLAPIGVSWGIGSVAELRQAGAVAIADTPAELLALLADGAIAR